MYTIEYGVKFFTAWAVPPEINFVTRYVILDSFIWDSLAFGNVDSDQKDNNNAELESIVGDTDALPINTQETKQVEKNINNWSDCIIKTLRLEPFEENPEFNKIEFYIRYILSIRSIIDLLCFLPLWIYIGGYNVSSLSFTVVRAFRIFRVFKLILSIKSIR